ncbi:MAG TPA: type II toxin-antitoxin system death-on-curing family toxin [bacterium]|nr:type II toxin-antitoxin system death-on-curing family toxin [bacterium]
MRIRWLSLLMVMEIHDQAVREGGGHPGVHRIELLESAVNRPRFKHYYAAERRVPALAAAYAYGIAKDHPFLDGNKRTAWLASRAFLARNGFSFDAVDDDIVETMVRLASGAIDEEGLTSWFARLSLHVPRL